MMTEEKTLVELRISSGPDRHKLIEALSHAYDEATTAGDKSVAAGIIMEPYWVSFETNHEIIERSAGHHVQITNLKEISAKITSLGHEDSSGESFFIEGFFIHGPVVPFKGYYHTLLKKGYINFEI